MLIDENWISVRIHCDETSEASGTLICLADKLHALGFQVALQIADVCERIELASVAVPAWIEGQRVLLEHSLEKTDRVVAILHNQPFLRGIAHEDLEAKLLTLCCSKPPEGYAKWSLRLLADKLVELNYVESISHVSVRRALKKTNLNLGKLRAG